MKSAILIHKETFYQKAENDIPGVWIVTYWINDPADFISADYFNTKKEAVEFEKTLLSYDDWATSQEMLLNAQ